MQALMHILLIVQCVVHLSEASVALRQEAKKAVGQHVDNALLGQDNHGLILVPATRHKRSINEEVTKYKRLSHSVHVQTDIRYR